MRTTLALLVAGLCALVGPPADAQQPDDPPSLLYESPAFTVTDTSVTQGRFRAHAPSRTELRSNYQRERTRVIFKFSINGQDNERPSGQDHRARLNPADGKFVTPVYTFGARQDADGYPQPQTATRRGTDSTFAVTFRVDMRHVLRAFRTEGVYDPPNGAPIPADDFEGVYIAGDTDPLSWDFGGAVASERFRLTDPDDDGVYSITLRFARRPLRPMNDAGQVVWRLQQDVEGVPEYTSDQRLVDALYRLSLEETMQLVREDGAFSAGAKWTGVWTRDISYSILLSLALTHPEAAKQSLLAKVDDQGRIIQDTGTGGSWPISSDRMTWALAAWEVYLTTGDRDWLQRTEDILRRSVGPDLKTTYDAEAGLVHGETSFMDWREQSYPDWMDPAAIYQSQTLSTSAVHARTYAILAAMQDELGPDAPADSLGPDRYRAVAESIRDGINRHLWQPERGVYSAFRYGRAAYRATDRPDALGNALAVLTGTADAAQAETVMRHFPVTTYGVPCFHPYIPGQPPYHNAGIWPFVVSYWTWAAAETGHAPAVRHGLGSIYRAAALFLTNKENMVAATGHFEGTEINSDRQLWSVAGTLATVYRVFVGMRFTPDGLRFQPFVPEAYGGTRRLTGVAYRDATLDITVKGHGDGIERITLDGQPLDTPRLPADLTGAHTVRITLDGTLPTDQRLNRAPDRYAPATPQPTRTEAASGGQLTWAAVPEATRYAVARNGTPQDTLTATQYALPAAGRLAEYQVRALGPDAGSFWSHPVRHVADAHVQTIRPPSAQLAREHGGYTGDGYLHLTQTQHTTVRFEVSVEEGGTYLLDGRYANGNGPINTDNKAAIRSVRVDGAWAGALVMPQRGTGVWTDWGHTNPLRLDLDAGTHTITVAYTDADQNMNGAVNEALLDHLRLTRIE